MNYELRLPVEALAKDTIIQSPESRGEIMFNIRLNIP